MIWAPCAQPGENHGQCPLQRLPGTGLSGSIHSAELERQHVHDQSRLFTPPRDRTEQNILREVGSYGRQIGHLAEALEVVVDSLQLLQSSALTQAQRDVLAVFLADVSKARMIKS